MNRQLLKQFIPPVMLPWLSRLIFGRHPVTFSGRYASWQQASNKSTGYASDDILNKVRSAARMVAKGEAVYERDSVLFDNIEYSYPVMAALAKITCIKGGGLSVLDFGGGLGSSYLQFSSFLSQCNPLTWSIIEQPNYVECGKSEFQNERLRFYHSVDECLASQHPSVVLFSSVLQYLETPFSVLEQIAASGIEYLLIDLTPFSQHSEDLLTVQRVNPPIYKADYPCWIFSEKRMISFLKAHYEVLLEFDSMDMPGLARFNARYRGFFCRLAG